ncbi:MAG: 3'(2'),5'-bisphosphate nucleotidase CysQ [Rhodobiaceae bacterium]|nr:3'(2'),5'-bisphosphate nucleotidase CysQ [Rhodobiaceae bacterium]MCC0054858.1 3'(2'),5'-bisphosphate nucleotidase CysQ [Rhodobiaceae bacterium]
MQAHEALQDLNLLREAAQAAGDLALRYHRSAPRSWTKGDNSPVSEADVAVDRLLRKTLTGARGNYGWLSEESEDNRDRLTRERVFVVDPIDGTRAFLEGDDQWVVSVAVVSPQGSECGVLYNPVRGEMYEAARGAGAHLDGHRLLVTSPGDNYRIAGSKRDVSGLNLNNSASIIDRRYVPSLAYRFALVAAGRFDATMTSGRCRDWDLAAAMLIVEEAGGVVRRIDGEPIRLNMPEPVQPPLVAGSRETVEFLTGRRPTDGAGP